jgi:Nif-specific regulatory protein
MPSLIVREPGQTAYVIELRDAIEAGRDPKGALVLVDGQVSRRHVRLEPTGETWRALDLGSRHGIRVNGVVATEAKLADGDVIQLGGVTLIYRVADQPTTNSVVRTVTQITDPPERANDDHQRRLRVLFETTRLVGALGDLDVALTRVLEMTLEVLACERGVVGLREPDAGAAGRRLGVARHAATVDEMVIPAACLAAIERREAILIRDPLGAGVRSAMCAPLEVAGRVLGYIFVDDRNREQRFAADDLDFLTALARLAASACDLGEQHRRATALAEALAPEGVPPLLGQSEPMRALRAQIARCAAGTATITICGETGAGKELVALHIHAMSARADQPFVTVNCAAIPESLIESELFGAQRGAFTGADKPRRGRFACAHRGTLFLDEIADLSAAAQAKVLRAIEAGEIHPVGAEQPLRVDVRIIAASHKRLADEVAAKRFREDLFYRLDVLEISVPPLRARSEDVLVLATHILDELARRAGRPAPALADDAREALRNYDWPGNVRQLRNELERALMLVDGPVIDASLLRMRPATASAWTPIEESERRLIEEGLRANSGNLQATARALEMPRNTLYRKIKKYGLR